MTKKIFLILIILLAFTLRFYKLSTYPALNADEAAIGYDAYSLIQTGMDEHGHPWPITFQSFNDFKPGLYFYTVLPFVKVLGLNEWAVRLPGASLGVLSVLMLYFLVKELFPRQEFQIAEIAALFLAISPWHLQFSRGGWEVNTATFFVITGLFFFFKSLNDDVFRRKIIKLVISSIFLVASFYTYHAVRVIVPLLGLSILIIYGKEIFKNFKPYLIFGIVSAILLIPLVLGLLSPGALSRVAGVGLFADQGPLNRINEQRGEYGNINNFLVKALHNKVVNYGLAFAENWTSHFNGEFLFMSGDSIERNKVPETGEMYLFDIVFLGVGFIFLSKRLNNSWKFIISWLVIAPVASALTFQSPNALRAENMVIPLTIISAYGLTAILNWLKDRGRWRIVGYVLIVFVVCWNFGRYLNMYYLHMSKIYPYSSQYGVKELVSYISQNQSKYKDIFVTERYDQPYILFLFYMKYPPQNFQFHHTLTTRDEFGFSTVADFDKYHFGPIDFSSLQNNYPNSLIIGTPEEIPQSANIIQRIYGTNGFEYFDVVQN
jgi:4-amino-4-deoxy-L-arabinose transferase-like glycosyltransferase